MFKKNKIPVFGILSGALFLSVVFIPACVNISNKTVKVPVGGISVDVPVKYKDDPVSYITDSAHKKYAGFFTKNAGVTTIKLENNKTVQFTDRSSKDFGDGAIYYSYMIFIPEIDSHLISCRWWEGGDYILVNNETGVVQNVWNVPGISPKKNRLAVANSDLIARYTSNGIQVFEIVLGKYIKLFQQELSWGPNNPRWLSNDAFAVDKYLSESEGKIAGQVIFKYNGKRWVEEEKKN